MRMLSSIVSQNDREIHCTCEIMANNPLLENQCFPVTGGVELLAQASGVLLGLKNAEAEVRPGAVVQIKKFSLWDAQIPVGSILHIYSNFQAGSLEAAMFTGKVFFDEQLFFSGSLMIATFKDEKS